MEDNFLKRILNILTNRLLIISVVFVVLFYILLAKLFTLQIVEGETYKNQQEVTDTVTLPVAATRGCIYDRLGRPLAVNETAFTVLMDANTAITADTFYQVVQLFEKNGETAVDTLPITKTEPYQFVWANSGTNETRWKTDMGFADKDMGLDAADSFNKLRTKFKIPDDMPNSEARKVLNLCCMLYLQRYHTYDPITIAYDVKQDTVTTIEEQNARYTGIYVDTQDLRYYPEGVYFANIIGYTGGMGGLSQDALDEKLAQGYSLSDKIGKTGLESSEESYLRGTSGSVTAEVDSLGKVVGYLPDKIDPQPGNDIYLTMDADFQKKFSDFLENALSQTLQNELLGIGATATADTHITLEEVFSSMVNGNVISVEQIMSSTQSDDSYAVRQYVLSANPNWAFPADRDFTATKKIITDGITGGSISSATMLLVMMDQGLITGTASDAANIRSGAASPLTVVLDKMQAGEITPQMVGLDPCTGSAVMVNVKNGDVLAAAGYPSFDPNELVNNMN
ncbi:MAG: hypothetical protein FWF44_03335, partial [Defluviitaleaceae bacterium]|nr:hypothetical protein [Defluviitaleaceae bacterium]